MHILILPSWYPQHAEDTVGSFFREQAQALVKQDLQVGVLSLTMYGLKAWRTFLKKRKEISFENDQGVLTYRKSLLNGFPKMPRKQSQQWVLSGLRLFEAYVKANGKPDLIHVHSILNAGLVAQQIKKRYGIPFVITEHSTAYARGLFSEADLTRASRCAQDADLRWAVSQPFAHLLSQKLSFKGHTQVWRVMPNVVHPRFLEASLSRPITPPFIFLSIAYLTPKKRVDLLIRAFTKAFKGQMHVHLHIGGTGDQELVLQQLSQSLGMTSQIFFLGKLSRSKVLKAMERAHAYALSSAFETFGVVLIEALALGRPLVATQCGGPEDIVTPQTGLIVEANNEEALTGALVQMHQHYADYSPSLLRAYCQQHFSETAVIRRMIKSYTEVLENKHA